MEFLFYVFLKDNFDYSLLIFFFAFRFYPLLLKTNLFHKFFYVGLTCSGNKVLKQCNTDNSGQNLRCPATCQDFSLNSTETCQR